MTIDLHPTTCRYFGRDLLGGGIIKETNFESRTVDKVISPIFVFTSTPPPTPTTQTIPRIHTLATTNGLYSCIAGLYCPRNLFTLVVLKMQKKPPRVLLVPSYCSLLPLLRPWPVFGTIPCTRPNQSRIMVMVTTTWVTTPRRTIN
jgi:hypothetical protein